MVLGRTVHKVSQKVLSLKDNSFAGHLEQALKVCLFLRASLRLWFNSWIMIDFWNSIASNLQAVFCNLGGHRGWVYFNLADGLAWTTSKSSKSLTSYLQNQSLHLVKVGRHQGEGSLVRVDVGYKFFLSYTSCGWFFRPLRRFRSWYHGDPRHMNHNRFQAQETK